MLNRKILEIGSNQRSSQLDQKQKFTYLSFNTSIDDYEKDGGPGAARLLRSFYHDSLRS